MLPVTSVAVAKRKSQFGMCDCTVVSDVGVGDFSLMVATLHVYLHVHVRSHASLCMDWILSF